MRNYQVLVSSELTGLSTLGQFARDSLEVNDARFNLLYNTDGFSINSIPH